MRVHMKLYSLQCGISFLPGYSYNAGKSREHV